ADLAANRLREELVVGKPGVLPREMRLDGEPLPLLQLLDDVPRGSLRHEPERIPGEIDLFLATLALRNAELVPEPRERVAAIQRDREVASRLEGLAHRLKRAIGSLSHSSAVPCSSRARVSSGNPHESISSPGRASPSGNG